MFYQHFKKWAIPGLFQYTFDNIQIFDDVDLWYRKQPLYQLSHNHYQHFSKNNSSPIPIKKLIASVSFY